MANIDELIRKAQTTNSPEAYEEIARMYYHGNGVVKDRAKALVYYRKAADLGSVHAQTCAGIMYYKGIATSKNTTMAKKYLKPAAARNSVEALRALGWMCYDGEYGFFSGGKGKAFEFWQRAAKLGDAESQIYIATSYLQDWGEERSNRKSAFWFMCAYQNRNATQAQIDRAKECLDKLDTHVDLNAVKAEIVRKYPKYINLK